MKTKPSQELQSRTSQFDYKAENANLVNIVNNKDMIIANRDRLIETQDDDIKSKQAVINKLRAVEDHLEAQLKAKDNTINQLKKDNTDLRTEITELKRVASVNGKFLIQVEKERDAKKTLLSQANLRVKTANDEIEVLKNDLSELKGKWYVKLFKFIGL